MLGAATVSIGPTAATSSPRCAAGSGEGTSKGDGVGDSDGDGSAASVLMSKSRSRSSSLQPPPPAGDGAATTGDGADDGASEGGDGLSFRLSSHTLDAPLRSSASGASDNGGVAQAAAASVTVN